LLPFVFGRKELITTKENKVHKELRFKSGRVDRSNLSFAPLWLKIKLPRKKTKFIKSFASKRIEYTDQIFLLLSFAPLWLKK
jgi:hypothetical protein